MMKRWISFCRNTKHKDDSMLGIYLRIDYKDISKLRINQAKEAIDWLRSINNSIWLYNYFSNIHLKYKVSETYQFATRRLFSCRVSGKFWKQNSSNLYMRKRIYSNIRCNIYYVRYITKFVIILDHHFLRLPAILLYFNIRFDRKLNRRWCLWISRLHEPSINFQYHCSSSGDWYFPRDQVISSSSVCEERGLRNA